MRVSSLAVLHSGKQTSPFADGNEKYDKALSHYDKTGDVIPFVDSMKDSMEQTWDVKTTQQRKLADVLLDQRSIDLEL